MKEFSESRNVVFLKHVAYQDTRNQKKIPTTIHVMATYFYHRKEKHRFSQMTG